MKGMILIPDISGFTNFVAKTNPEIGVVVIRELLDTIIENNSLPLNLSEVEGDALLFYKIGKPLCVSELLAALAHIDNAFNAKFSSLKSLYGLTEVLLLKFIVHFGDLTVYDIRGFKKLYGTSVIESHILLKNGLRRRNYIIITDDYFHATAETPVTPVTADSVLECRKSRGEHCAIKFDCYSLAS